MIREHPDLRSLPTTMSAVRLHRPGDAASLELARIQTLGLPVGPRSWCRVDLAQHRSHGPRRSKRRKARQRWVAETRVSSGVPPLSPDPPAPDQDEALGTWTVPLDGLNGTPDVEHLPPELFRYGRHS
jgi:hypothetical protein